MPNLVAAGDVTATSAVLWARATVTGPVRFEYGLSQSFAAGSTESMSVDVVDRTVPAKVEIGGLSPGSLYFYRATDAEGAASSGRFRTPALEGRNGLRFGVSGDWRGDLAPYPSVGNVPDRGLDLFVALGDTIYADVPSPDVPISQCATIEDFRAKHNEVYSERAGLNTLAALRASTAVLAMIDDHEVTNDFAGGAPPSMGSIFAGEMVDFVHDTAVFTAGTQAFHEFNPIRTEFYGDTGDPRTSGKMKLYRARNYGLDAAFFMLDARTFRDEELPTIGATAAQSVVEDFLRRSFDAARTMLGRAQIEELKDDLLAASAAGVTWKFVLVPEPIQNLGPSLASDRFEGYAAERTELLRFIDENAIANVVFIAADIHGTVVNNLTYQLDCGGPQLYTKAWEITTGSVAYAAPFGPTVASYVDEDSLGPAAGLFQLVYGLADRAGRDGIVTFASQLLLGGYGLDAVGLDFSPIDARLTKGGYVAVNTFGWTEFEIDAESQCLAVSTWGIDWYDGSDLAGRREEVLARTPQIVSQFIVRPEGSRVLVCPNPSANEGGAFSQCGCGVLFPIPFIFLGMTGISRKSSRRWSGRSSE
ncbi:MAG: alkaline phosphatase D family protein [Planctomycetes bacterium]|nr:alkaline phosphatase D family protein [Planctomycetota bacterium]